MCNKSDNFEWREYIVANVAYWRPGTTKTHTGTLYRRAPRLMEREPRACRSELDTVQLAKQAMGSLTSTHVTVHTIRQPGRPASRCHPHCRRAAPGPLVRLSLSVEYVSHSAVFFFYNKLVNNIFCHSLSANSTF